MVTAEKRTYLCMETPVVSTIN